MGYKKPILGEIYAEMNLSGVGLGNSFVEIVPDLKPLGLTEIELAPIRQMHITALGNQEPQISRAQYSRLRVWSSNRTRLAQLSKQQVAVNLVGDYPGWPQFRELFSSVKDQIQKKAKISVSNLVLGTIDRATIPASGFTTGAYLNTRGKLVPAYFENCSVPADLVIGKGIAVNDGFNRQVRISQTSKGTHFEIVIHSTFQNVLKPTDKVDEVLERLHDESNDTFEEMITDRMRNEIMGGQNG